MEQFVGLTGLEGTERVKGCFINDLALVSCAEVACGFGLDMISYDSNHREREVSKTFSNILFVYFCDITAVFRRKLFLIFVDLEL